MIELNPCPFCGHKAELRTYIYGAIRDELYWVWCEDCEAEIPSYPTPEEAAAAWNRRADHEDLHVAGRLMRKI